MPVLPCSSIRRKTYRKTGGEETAKVLGAATRSMVEAMLALLEGCPCTIQLNNVMHKHVSARNKIDQRDALLVVLLVDYHFCGGT